jgi:ribonucleases P/MRP protein subunit RPP40
MTKHFPTKLSSKPCLIDGSKVVIPTLNPSAEDISSQSNFEDFASDIYEWISLVRLQSPRIEKGDDIDPYLSRYRVPSEAEYPLSSNLCMIRWQGFTSPAFAQQVLVKAFLSVSKSWFAFVACSLAKGMVGDMSETTVLRPPGAPGEYVLWEVKGPEVE